MSDLFKQLNEKQKEAVSTINGPLLIIAGAGSGKTKALTHRIAHQMEKGISPWNIMAVTFTNKAANEMKERVKSLIVGNKDNISNNDLPMMGTFHSICVRILRKHIHLIGMENSFVIYDDADQLALIKNIMREKNIEEKKFNPRAILSHISSAKSELVSCTDYGNMAHSYFTEQVAQLYPIYEQRLQKNTALDFDDLIKKTIELLQSNQKCLDHYQERFKYISVDEYQDTNHAQYTLISMLAQKYRNICAIGDNDQSIYSWRGADMRNILSFEKDYKECKVIKLEQNYRSTQVILDTAHNIISRNKNRIDKKLWTEKEGGEKVKIWSSNDERHEGEMIAQEIKRLNEDSECPDYSDFVILYRTNAQSRVMEETMLRHAIPYKIIGGVKFYQRKEIKDLISYLRIIQNPNDDISLLRIINVPSRKIGAKTLEILQNYARRRSLSLFETLSSTDSIDELQDGKRKIIKKLHKDWKELISINKQYCAAGVIKTILQQMGYKDYLLEDGTDEGITRFENVQELISVASKYDSLEPGISLATFLEEIALISDLDSIDEKDNAVTLMTIHSAKGLEFKNVFVVGLEEGIFPHSRSLLDREQLEEERRLMYVATTRAMEKLYLLFAKERLLYGEHKSNAPSQFLDDVPEELSESNKVEKAVETFDRSHLGFKEIPSEKDDSIEVDPTFGDGDKVEHPSFGKGVVINIVGGIVTVAFKNPRFGVKKLALNIAPLKRC